MANNLLNLAWAALLPPPAKLVLLRLADRVNDKDPANEAWPSANSLAGDTGLHPRTVKREIKRLIAEGHISKAGMRPVKWDGGQTFVSVYRIHPKAPSTVADEHGGGGARCSIVPSTVAYDAEHGGIQSRAQWPTATQTVIEPKRNPKEPSGNAEKLYSMFPRKQGRLAALKAITKALKAETFGVLLEAVTAYAAAVALWSEDDHCFIPYPATWFNEERWKDDRKGWELKGASQPSGKGAGSSASTSGPIPRDERLAILQEVLQ